MTLGGIQDQCHVFSPTTCDSTVPSCGEMGGRGASRVDTPQRSQDERYPYNCLQTELREAALKWPFSDTTQTQVHQAGDRSAKALGLKAARCAQRMKGLPKIRGAKLKENGRG